MHMLRHYIGDELFWKGISTYYATYRNKNASSADFEKVTEDVTGKDLSGFFHEWLERKGHPHLKIKWDYDNDKKRFTIEMDRVGPDFSFPLEYSIDGVLYKTDISKEYNSFSIPLAQKPASVVIDPNVVVLADYEFAQ